MGKTGNIEKRTQEDAKLVRLIQEIMKEYHGRYGSPRAQKALWDKHGKRVSRKKVTCLMRKHGLQARRRGKFIPVTKKGQ
jgi:transposase InsO family protein